MGQWIFWKGSGECVQEGWACVVTGIELKQREREDVPHCQAWTWAIPLSPPPGHDSDSFLPVPPLVPFYWVIPIIIQNTVILKFTSDPTSHLQPTPHFFPSFIAKSKSCLCPLLLLVVFLKPTLIRLLLSPLNKITLVKLTEGVCVSKSNGHFPVLFLPSLSAGFDPVSLLKTLLFSN